MFITTVHFHSNAPSQNKLIFGIPAFKIALDSFSERNFKAGFNPDSIFCILTTEYNKYGIRRFNLFILRALNEYESGNVINFVTPGAEILLSARGKKHVNRVLRWLNELHLDHERLSAIRPAFFIAAANRFSANLHPRERDGKNNHAFLQRLIS